MRKALRLLFLLLLALTVLVTAVGWWLLGDLPDPEEIADRLVLPSIRITDRHGRTLYDVVDVDFGRHTNLPLQSIPMSLQQATIATEDKFFYTNPGVDVPGIVRAFWINLRGGEVLAGGSTITQQVARNLLLTADERTQRTVRRKLRESWLAWRVGRAASKDEVLALYLNQMYYGAMAYGVEAAAHTYFGKEAAALTLAESALIAGLTQAPAVYNPFTHPEQAKERQQVVLDLMLAAGYISPAEREQAGREPLQLAATPYPLAAPHFVMMVQAELDRLLARQTVYDSGGLVVRTTLDLDWQQQAEAVVHEQLFRLNEPADGGPTHHARNAALVALDPQSGALLALVGNPDYFDQSNSGAINMALARRQPGSALKPVIYAAALAPDARAPWTAATMLPDVRTVFATHDGEPYIPVNFDREEHGPVLLRQALASSLNIPAVLAIDTVGVPEAVAFAERLGAKNLGDPAEYDLSFALGGGPVSLLDLTAVYGAFANGGFRVTPFFIMDITDVAGNEIYMAQPAAQERVMDERVAWLIGDILSDDDARALGFGANSLLNLDRIAAVKTGTTTDLHDNWTVGYTPEVVTGVWVGNADHEPMIAVTGLSGAGPIWHYFMRSVLAGVPESSFPRPEGLVQEEICTLSGLLPSPDCPYQRQEWFIAGTQPQMHDTFYRQVLLDGATGFLADSQTPPSREQSRVVLDLPPQFHDWARAAGLMLYGDLAGAPVAADTSAETSAETAVLNPVVQIDSPAPHTSYRLSPSLPPSAQQVPLAATVSANIVEITFWLDGRLLTVLGEPPFVTWWALTPGEHQVWVEGRTSQDELIVSPMVSFTVTDLNSEHNN